MNSRRIQIIVLVTLIVLAVVGLRLWVLHDVPMTASLGFEDVNNHLLNLDLRRRRATLDATQLADPYLRDHLEDTVPLNPEGWPPGVYTVARPWVGIFGPLSVWTTQLTNLLFYAVLLWGCFGLGRAVAGTRAGLWVALLAGLSPALVSASWYFTLDFPLAAMTTVGLWLLLRTERFGSWRGCLLFALWSALGVLVKPPYAMHMVLPTMVVLGLGLWRGPRRRVRLGLGAATAAMALGIICLVQVRVITGLARELWIHTTVPPPEENIDFEFITVQPWSLHGVLAVAIFLAMKTPHVLLLISLPGLVLAHLRRRPLTGRWMLLAFFWGTYVILTLLVHRQGRYCLPLQPLICLLTVWWIWRGLSARWRTPVLALVAAAYATVLVLDYRHADDRPWSSSDWFRPLINSGYHEMRMPGAEVLARLRSTTYHPECDLRPVIKQLVTLAKNDGSRLTVGVGAALPEFSSSEYLALMVRQVIADRMVTWTDHQWHKKDPPPATVIFVHQPGFDTRKLGPLTRVSSNDGVLRCTAGRKRAYRITLLRRTGP